MSSSLSIKSIFLIKRSSKNTRKIIEEALKDDKREETGNKLGI
jgi:hypothetical protein